jgi:hypothetical protein
MLPFVPIRTAAELDLLRGLTVCRRFAATQQTIVETFPAPFAADQDTMARNSLTLFLGLLPYRSGSLYSSSAKTPASPRSRSFAKMAS